MRPLLLFLIAILLLMAKHECHGCGKKFKRISTHMERCSRVSDLLQGGLKRKMDAQDDREARRRAKRERREQEAEEARQEEARKAEERRARQEVRCGALVTCTLLVLMEESFRQNAFATRRLLPRRSVEQGAHVARRRVCKTWYRVLTLLCPRICRVSPNNTTPCHHLRLRLLPHSTYRKTKD